ncbi:MAG: FlgD immunoglobulin-like domain containing protein [bacterium]
MSQAESFRTQTGITYPMLRDAGLAGIGSLYATSYDAMFVVDGAGFIRYRANLSWSAAAAGAAVDAALADLLVPVRDIPGRDGFELQPAYPNPFNPSTTIPYILSGTGGAVDVKLQILDLQGRLVRTLVNTRQVTGETYTQNWNGVDETGRRMPSGAYLVNLAVADESQTRFLTLLK